MTNPIQANIYVMLGFTQKSFNTTDGVKFFKKEGKRGKGKKGEKKEMSQNEKKGR